MKTNTSPENRPCHIKVRLAVTELHKRLEKARGQPLKGRTGTCYMANYAGSETESAASRGDSRNQSDSKKDIGLSSIQMARARKLDDLHGTPRIYSHGICISGVSSSG